MPTLRRTWRSRTGRRGRSAPHVVVVVQNLPVPLDRRVWLECRSLRAAGYEVTVICPLGRYTRREVRLEGVRILRYPNPGVARGAAGYLREFTWCWLWTSRLFARVRAEGPVDALQACNPPDTYWALALLARPFGTRFVFDQHDLCPEVYQARFSRPGGLLLHALRALERGSYAVADHVISTNESYRQVALDRGRRAPEGVTTVRSGPEDDVFRRAEPRPELRRGRQHLAVYLGVMGPQDGVDGLLETIDDLVHRRGRRDTSFALLGFGDCLDELRRDCSERGLDEWVTLPGHADDATIADHLSTAALGLCPDPRNPLNEVSTMNKTLEYMAFGLPVASYDLHETRVSAGPAARYAAGDDAADLADVVEELLDDPALRRRLGGAGRDRVEESLAWRHQAPRYVGVYDRLLGRVRAEEAPEAPAASGAGLVIDLRDEPDRERVPDASVPATRREVLVP